VPRLDGLGAVVWLVTAAPFTEASADLAGYTKAGFDQVGIVKRYVLCAEAFHT